MVYFLAGGKPRQTVPTRILRRLAVEGVRPARMALRGVLQQRRRSRRDAGAASAGGRGGRGRFARRLDARAPAADPGARRRGEIRPGEALGRGAARRSAPRLLQAHHRRAQGRRLAAAGGEGAGRSRRRRGKPHGAADDRLCPGAARPDAGGLRRADRRGGRRRRARARRRPALSLLPRTVLAAPARRDAGNAGPALGLDRRMEVRRHPRATDPARRRMAPMVARRRADLRRLSRPRAPRARPA